MTQQHKSPDHEAIAKYLGTMATAFQALDYSLSRVTGLCPGTGPWWKTMHTHNEELRRVLDRPARPSA
jgi:hypothetical protein